MLADTFEALIGAIYLDSTQGLPKVHQLVSGPLAPSIKAFTTEQDYISCLQIHVQRIKRDCLTSDDLDYVEISHSKDWQNRHTYVYEVQLQDKAGGQGTGSTIKEAKQAAAKTTLQKLEI
jgi:dsRNA-specific ribonuclease